jgi:hypothetical protein
VTVGGIGRSTLLEVRDGDDVDAALLPAEGDPVTPGARCHATHRLGRRQRRGTPGAVVEPPGPVACDETRARSPSGWIAPSTTHLSQLGAGELGWIEVLGYLTVSP